MAFPIEVGFRLMQDFGLPRCSRKCFVSGEPISAGERYFSVVVQVGGDLQRRDYAASSWEGPPPDAIGWWPGRMPAAEQTVRQPAAAEVLLERWEQLLDDPQQATLAYLFGLWLVRRRILEPHTPPQDMRNSWDGRATAGRQRAVEDSSGASDEILLRQPGIGTEYRLTQSLPTAEQVPFFEQALSELMYSSA